MQITIDLDVDFEKKLEELRLEYGEKYEKINGLHEDNMNFTSFIDVFTKDDDGNINDISIDGNANVVGKDVPQLLGSINKPHTKLISLNKIYYEMKKEYGIKTANEWLECEWNGTFYLHNSTKGSFLPYCYAYDLKDICEKGLFFIDKFKANPAKHLSTFNNHILEFISWTSNRQTGAVGLPNYLIYSYYYWKEDITNGHFTKTPDYYRDQCFQQFIFDVNQPYLRVVESAFTNITIMDREYLVGLFGDRQYPNGEFVVEFVDEIMEYQKAFMRVVNSVREENYMTFPVITYSLVYKDDKFVDEEFARWCSDTNSKWCDGNFYISDSADVLSSCCRMTNDTSKVHGFINSIGGTSLDIGSVVVNTINLYRLSVIGLDSLEHYTTLCMKVNHVVRGIIKRNIEKGLLSTYTNGLCHLDKQFNTIGITALFESVERLHGIDTDILGNKSYNEKGLVIAKGIIESINKMKEEWENMVDYQINVEAVPAERANVVLCEKDNEMGEIYVNNYFIYSNQHLPLNQKCTMTEKIKLARGLDGLLGGGVISHINLESPFANTNQAWEMLLTLAREKVVYSAFNIVTNVCESGHGFFTAKCPKCGGEIADQFTRVVGFLTPVSSFSNERKKEFNQRKWY